MAIGASARTLVTMWASPSLTQPSGPAPGEVKDIVKALNKHAKFLRGVLGRHIDMKFTPDLKFVHDDSFDAASKMNRLFEDPRVKQDLDVEENDL